MRETRAAPTIEDLTRSIEDGLRRQSEPERRRVTEGYFDSRLAVLGVSAGEIRSVVRDHRDEWRALSGGSVVALAVALCRGGTHEGRQAGYEILEGRPDAQDRLDRRTLERLGAGNDNWASVDTFATRVAGPAWRERRVDDAAIRDWAASPDRWWRRTAVVSTVALNVAARGGTGDSDRTLDICARVADDHDDMVVKGLSWALRALVRHDPAAVRVFLASREPVLAARVKREVRHKLETGRKG